MRNRSTTIIIIVIVLLIASALAYWYFFWNGAGNTITPVVTGSRPSTGFKPFTSSAPLPTDLAPVNGLANANQSSATTTNPNAPIPALRLLSDTPVGGYGASTTASFSTVRWIDRGRGNVYQAESDKLGTGLVSNTILPRMYESSWNRDLSGFIGSLLTENEDASTVVYAGLKVRPAGETASSSNASDQVSQATPYELKGNNLPDKTLAFAVSPDGKKVFMLIGEGTDAGGYVANFDGTAVKKIFSTPLTEVNADWPSASIIALTTKGSAGTPGYLYFVDPVSGVWHKILGPMAGLSAKTSHDGRYVIASYAATNQTLGTAIYKVGSAAATDPLVRTLADKCAWGNYYLSLVYCAVPVSLDPASYPDDWYRGAVSFTDKIWQINASTGEVHLVTSIVDQSDRIIDAFNLGLDNRDDFLYFMNKNDLSLWSYDLSGE